MPCRPFSFLGLLNILNHRETNLKDKIKTDHGTTIFQLTDIKAKVPGRSRDRRKN